MTTSLFKNIDPVLRKGASHIVKILRSQGHKSYIAGGAVRDLLLDRPIGDLDLATSANPNTVEKLFPVTIPVGKQFGVIIVVENSVNFEVTTFRKEGNYSDGRRPDGVSFVEAHTDVKRRDFTVNGLFLDPFSGEILDYCNGQRDVRERIIRTIGSPSRRFREDKLRLMRAVRLAGQLNFQIEKETWTVLQKLAPEIKQVSRERIRDELLKILTGGNVTRGLNLLRESGLLNVILPDVAALEGVRQPPEFHPEGDVWTHTCLMFSLAENPSETLALGILLHDVGKPPTYLVRDRIRFDRHAEIGAEMTSHICRDLRLSNRQCQTIVELVRQHLRFIHVQQMRKAKLKRFLRQEDFSEHLELHRLDCLASHGNLSSYEFCLQKLEELSEEKVQTQPLLNGHDLIDLGLKPGPIFSDLLTQVEDRQLEGLIQSHQEALDWVRKTLSNN